MRSLGPALIAVVLLGGWARTSAAAEEFFATVPAWTGPYGYTISVALGDVDGDGDLDLVRGNYGEGATLNLNTGETFDSVATWTGPPEATLSVALGDVDGDGDLDLVCGNRFEGSTLRLNTGGTFDSMAAWAGPPEATLSVALGDVDGDGDLDLVCGNIFKGSTLYLNTNGLFALSPAWTGPVENTESAALGDVDGDGDLDLVCGNDGEGSTLHLNTGGTFDSMAAWVGPLGTTTTRGIALGDVDGDGDLDLVCGNYGEGATLYLNTGGTFTPTAVWTGPAEGTWSVALGDVDGDGDLDLIRGNQLEVATLYLNNGGTFAPTSVWTGPVEFTQGIALGDVDGDGDLDLVRGNIGESTLYLNSGGAFASTATWTGPPEATLSVALGDVDGDGDLDLVRGNSGDLGAGTTLYLNTGGTFAPTAAWTGPVEFTQGIALGDVDGDGDLDLVRGNDPGGSTLHLNTGSTLEPTPIWTGPPEGTRGVTLGDVDGDGDLDLVCGNYGHGATLYLNAGGTFAPTAAWTGPVENTLSMALSDIDGDGDLDLVRGNDPGGATLYLNIGGTFASTAAWTGPLQSTRSVALGDVDGDGDPDLVCGQVVATLYLNTGGTFASRAAWTGPAENTYSVALGDVDGDGDLDLVRGNHGMGSTLCLNTGHTFAPAATWTGPGAFTWSVALGDVDGDGSPDLVCGNVGGGYIREAATLYLRKSPWQFESGAPARQLPNNPAYLKSLHAVDAGANRYRLSFTAIDVEADPVSVVGEYQAGGSASWQPMILNGSPLHAGPFATSLAGVAHVLNWDVSRLLSDHRNVVVRLRAVSPPRRVGVIQFQPSYVARVASPARIAVTALDAPAGGHPAGAPIALIATLPEGPRFARGQVFYRAGGAAAYDSRDLTLVEIRPGVTTTTASIPAVAVGARGVEFWVRLETQTATLTDPVQDPAGHPRVLRTEVATLAEAAAHVGGRYRMVTVPLEFNVSAASSLESMLSDQPDFGPYDITRWRSFRWQPAIPAYLEISSANTPSGLLRPEPGRAFWLVARDANRIDTAPVSGRSTVPTPITLEPGWNQVGNPYAYPVAWSSVSASNASGPVALEPAVAWDEGAGRYATSDVTALEPFTGYWVHNATADPVTLNIASVEAVAAPAATASSAAAMTHAPTDSLSWSVQITAACGAASDSRNFAGVSPSAHAGNDALDRAEPPMAPGEALSLYFVGSEPGVRRSFDLRAALDAGDAAPQGRQWAFDMARTGETVQPAEASLTFTGLENVPAGVELRLVDRTLGRTIDLRREATYRYVVGARGFVADAAEARFALIAGTTAYVEAARSGLPAPPVRTQLFAPYPNPVAGTSLVRFELARAGRVTLEAYDFAGRRVRTLADGPREAGRYELAWNGNNDSGQRLSPGVYLLRLAGPDRGDTRKVVVVR